MNSPSDSPPTKTESFSLPLFCVTIGLTNVLLLALLRFLAPSVWESQFLAEPWLFLPAVALVSLGLCFFEFFFHRYILHMPAIPGLRRLYRQHTLHHALTRIGRRPVREGRTVLCVENKFPIMEEEQGEGSFFPWYALATFSLMIAPVLAFLHWLAPAFPWWFAGLAAVTNSLLLYEVLHAINHWPIEKWLPLIEHRTWGWFWRPAYTFHLRHHAVIECNESVSGFFGLPVADWAFGTCLIPRTIYTDGEDWRPENFTPPRPVRFIRWLDGVAQAAVDERRADAAVPSSASPERPYTRGEEVANWLTHGIGAVLSAIALTLLIVVASARGDAWHVVSFTVFGLSLLVLYTASTLYHLSKSERRRWLFRRLDRAAIFLLIAGTYTPFLLTNLRGPWGWSLFGVIWGLCGAGAVFTLWGGERYRSARIIACLFAGWLILVALKPLLATVPGPGIWLLFAGGACYTLGVAFYLWRRLRYHHAVWHGFVIGGSTCHFLAVLLFLVPGTN